ncbi:ras GTPase-activating protein 1 [Galendromus occidentalis]|uniref:Ras GTPase-activating protein 1 n=1 Tax=Galendromus occidentalis TaxID=34638 RepID=A0AAJ6VVG7_9ACAR|nr:ras GTPase-activating protein 1 [Galendromus occidentalis]
MSGYYNVECSTTNSNEDDYDPFGSTPSQQPKSLPKKELLPRAQFFHGKIDRHVAECRLQQANQRGAYLVRQSKNGFVLSFRGHSGIHHFRIAAVCGDFYIGGRRFSTLSELVGYYTHVSDILKSERLHYHVVPPEPAPHNRKVVAILPYNKLADTDELSFKKGDVFEVEQDMGDGWLWCKKVEGEGLNPNEDLPSGLVYHELVADFTEECYPWYHGSISAVDAAAKLVEGGEGSFLVRPSDRSPGDYSIFLFINKSIQRFRIEKKQNTFVMGGRYFDTLEAIITRYKTEHIAEGHCLGDPILKAPQFGVPNSQAKVEEIYSTIQQLREQNTRTSTAMKGFLHKKTVDNKKWKQAWFVLNAGEAMLYFYDNPHRTKPRGIIDLGCSGLYAVHDSLFDQPHCFQLVERALPCLSTIYYLSAPDGEAAQDWYTSLSKICNPQSGQLRHICSMKVCLIEAKRLPPLLVLNPFCVMSLDDIKIARSQVKSAPDPVWEEEYCLDDIPSNINSFTVTVCSKGKKDKNADMAQVILELKDMWTMEPIDKWYPLQGVSPVLENWGSLHLRVHFSKEVILPISEYATLRQLLLEDDFSLVMEIQEVFSRETSLLAKNLLTLFIAEKKEAKLLKALGLREIENETDASIMFRGSSLFTSMIDLYMKNGALDFIRSSISAPVASIVNGKQSCELNPAKLDSLHDACTNAEHLLAMLDDFTEKIFASVYQLPLCLRYLLATFQKAIIKRWPNEHLLRTQVISSFIFLRLLCPAIINPHQYKIVTSAPSPMASRNLMLVAKCLQNLSNLAEFGLKEQWMEVVNPFILKNKSKVIRFIEEICAVNTTDVPRGMGECGALKDTARALESIFSLTMCHLSEVKSQPRLKKLAMVCEMLVKHKEKLEAPST